MKQLGVKGITICVNNARKLIKNRTRAYFVNDNIAVEGSPPYDRTRNGRDALTAARPLVRQAELPNDLRYDTFDSQPLPLGYTGYRSPRGARPEPGLLLLGRHVEGLGRRQDMRYGP
jgi:hypothetical protein